MVFSKKRSVSGSETVSFELKNQRKKVKQADIVIHPYHLLTTNEIFYLRQHLLSWFTMYRRTLPWRGDPPPFSSISLEEKHISKQHTDKIQTVFPWKMTAYGIWVSEVMLQQTQVSVVIPYWIRWMTRWPTLLSLSEATEESVRHVWAGLGYYGRALRLLETSQILRQQWCAKQSSLNASIPIYKGLEDNYSIKIKEKTDKKDVQCLLSNTACIQHTHTSVTASDQDLNKNHVRDIEDIHINELSMSNHQQHMISHWDIPFPRHHKKDLLLLPGIGDYTAGAILSIAFGQSLPAIDGNVIRVFSRLRGLASEANSNKLLKIIQVLTKESICPDNPGDFNQGLMDLGATICCPTHPKCHICPIQKICHSYAESHYHTNNKKNQHKSCITIPDVKNHHNVKMEYTPTQHIDSSSNESLNTLVVTIMADTKSGVESNRELLCDPRVTFHKDCDLCDPQFHCSAFRPDDYPLPKKKKLSDCSSLSNTKQTVQNIQYYEAVIIYRKTTSNGIEVLLKQRPPSGLLAKEWGPITILSTEDNISQMNVDVHMMIKTNFFSELDVSNMLPNDRFMLNTFIKLGEIKHVFSHVTHKVSVSTIQVNDLLHPTNATGYRWVNLKSNVEKENYTAVLRNLGITTKYMEKIMQLFLNQIKNTGS